MKVASPVVFRYHPIILVAVSSNNCDAALLFDLHHSRVQPLVVFFVLIWADGRLGFI